MFKTESLVKYFDLDYKLLRLLSILLLLSACGTNREGDLKPASKLYHNTTARYNGYFNAKELYFSSVRKLDDAYRDNYNRILPFYKHVSADNVSSVAGDLDNAIKKATLVVNLHPQSKWVDDCYILSGKCQFIKKDYDAAVHTFEYMIKEFAPENLIKAGINRKNKFDEKREQRERELARKEGREYRRTSAKRKAARAKSKKKSKRGGSRSKAKKGKKKKREKKIEPKNTDKDKSREKRLKERSKSKKKSSKQKQEKQIAQTRKERLKARKKQKKASDKRKKREKKAADNTKDREVITMVSPKPKSADKKKPTPKSEQPLEQETIKKDNYVLKHMPSQFEAMLWLAKSYVAQKRYNDALFRVNSMARNPNLPDKILDQIPEVKAYAFLEMKDYAKAIEPLKELIDRLGRKKAVRYNYILGQIYMQSGQTQQAAQAFSEVVKAHPEFEMEFNARINQVRCQWGKDKNNQQLIELLNKMLKEEKNEQFQDQIHFALAEIYHKMGDVQSTRKHMLLAAHKGKSNPHIQAEAYLVLADFAYQKDQYVKAKHYYDSSLQFLAQTDERYKEKADLRDRLSDVVLQLNTIALQDSLLKISGLSAEEKRLLAYRIKEQNQARSNAGPNRKNNAKSFDPNTGAAKRAGVSTLGSIGDNRSNFFAYNEKLVKKGLKDFTKVWGNRLLEDNWRRQHKRSNQINISEEELQEIEAEELTDEEIQKILRDVPTSEEDIRKANDIKMNALFLLAGYYYSRLDNLDKSINTYLEFVHNYPQSPFTEESYYRLYLAYKTKGMMQEANKYKKNLEDQYPDSEFLKIINDPNYFSKKEEAEHSVARAYDKAYESFANGEAYQALVLIGNAKEQFENIPKQLKAKFALLRAMCLGKTEGQKEYLQALDEVITKYNSTDEAKRAKEIIRYIRGDKNVFGEKENKKKSRYIDQKERLHYVLVVFKNTDENINVLRSAVSDYNRKKHKLAKLRVGNVYLSTDDKDPILIIRKFPTGNAAMKYYNALKKDKEEFLPQFEYQILTINQRNYRELLRSKTLEDYILFFKETYL